MKFTYGFELEGAISQELGSKLCIKNFGTADAPRELINQHFHQDGSVRAFPDTEVNNWFLLPTHGCNCGKCLTYATEYSSPVFTNLNKMLLQIAMFEDGKHYLWDYSCGLHLNLGVSDARPEVLKSVMTNFDFLRKLRNASMRFCEHQRYRLTHPTKYYKFYENSRNLLSDAQVNEKHRFMRFHNHGYLECRFLCPCEHKLQNVKKVIEIFSEYLNGKKIYSHSVKVPTHESVERKDYTFKLPRENKGYEVKGLTPKAEQTTQTPTNAIMIDPLRRTVRLTMPLYYEGITGGLLQPYHIIVEVQLASAIFRRSAIPTDAIVIRKFFEILGEYGISYYGTNLNVIWAMATSVREEIDI